MLNKIYTTFNPIFLHFNIARVVMSKLEYKEFYITDYYISFLCNVVSLVVMAMLVILLLSLNIPLVCFSFELFTFSDD